MCFGYLSNSKPDIMYTIDEVPIIQQVFELKYPISFFLDAV